MALLNRPAEYDKLYDSEGRLQGGLSAMEELAQVLAMKTGEQHDADAMDESEDELEPAGELPVSDRTQSMSDSDEEMSSDGDNSDEDMDDIAIDDPPAALVTETPDAAGQISSETPPAALVQSPTPAQPPLSPSPSPSPGPARKNSDPANSPLSRPRSAHSRRSLRRSSRRESLLVGTLPPGERLKQKFLDINLIPDVLVRSYRRIRLRILTGFRTCFSNSRGITSCIASCTISYIRSFTEKQMLV
jgi:serine/threonine-protein phosphatase 6 regulatory subunit 3